MITINVLKHQLKQPLLQSYVSHDPSEIILKCWFETQLLLIISSIQIINDSLNFYYQY